MQDMSSPVVAYEGQSTSRWKVPVLFSIPCRAIVCSSSLL